MTLDEAREIIDNAEAHRQACESPEALQAFEARLQFARMRLPALLQEAQQAEREAALAEGKALLPALSACYARLADIRRRTLQHASAAVLAFSEWVPVELEARELAFRAGDALRRSGISPAERGRLWPGDMPSMHSSVTESLEGLHRELVRLNLLITDTD